MFIYHVRRTKTSQPTSIFFYFYSDKEHTSIWFHGIEWCGEISNKFIGHFELISLFFMSLATFLVEQIILRFSWGFIVFGWKLTPTSILECDIRWVRWIYVTACYWL